MPITTLQQLGYYRKLEGANEYGHAPQQLRQTYITIQSGSVQYISPHVIWITPREVY